MLKTHLFYGFVCLTVAVAGSACATTERGARSDENAAPAGAQAKPGSQTENGRNSAVQNSPVASVTPEIALEKPTPDTSAANDDDIRHLDPFHFTVVKDWLKDKPDWRVLGEADYGPKRLKLLREIDTDPRAHPFYITGDFNRDGMDEFAVMLVSRKNKGVRAVAVFDSPPVTREKHIKPTFFLEDINDGGGDLILHGSEAGIYVGEAGSDSGFLLEPMGKTYKVTDPFAGEN